MKKELQELGLLNTKTLTKLVFYNERLAFLCRSDRSRGVSSALSWYPSVVARTWCKNDKVSWRGLKTVVNLPQKSETKKQGYEDKEQSGKDDAHEHPDRRADDHHCLLKQ